VHPRTQLAHGAGLALGLLTVLSDESRVTDD
jgi:hypothetical protein